MVNREKKKIVEVIRNSAEFCSLIPVRKGMIPAEDFVKIAENWVKDSIKNSDYLNYFVASYPDYDGYSSYFY